MLEMRQYATRRARRDDRIMRDLSHDLQYHRHVTRIKAHHYFIMELKFLCIGMFSSLIDLIFSWVCYMYILVVYRGHLKKARNNPDANLMLGC